MEGIKVEKLRPEVRKKVVPYLKELLKIHGKNIISINLYGSATGKDFSPKTSDINLLVVFHQLPFEVLEKSLKLVSWGIDRKISCPLFLTLEHIRTSQDVFPIEFLEMKENHICLYGEDILANINIEGGNLRLFCEEQIKGKLIRLRQAYLEIGLKRKGIEALMKESMFSLIPVFRNLLRLKGIIPPVDKEDILVKVSSEFDLEKEVFLAILKDKRDDEKIAGKDIEVYFAKYLSQINKLAVKVDKL